MEFCGTTKNLPKKFPLFLWNQYFGDFGVSFQANLFDFRVRRFFSTLLWKHKKYRLIGVGFTLFVTAYKKQTNNNNNKQLTPPLVNTSHQR